MITPASSDSRFRTNPNEAVCFNCSADRVRLHRTQLGDDPPAELLCDDCYEAMTGLVATCEDYCSRGLNHVGTCHAG